MAGLKDIKELGKAGNAKEAYRLAKEDLEQGQPWGQLTTGWALRYLIEEDARNGHYDQIVAHLDELQSLDQIPDAEIDKISENISFWIGFFIKRHLSEKSPETPGRLSTLFSKIQKYKFTLGIGYSMLLDGCIRHDGWHELLEFLDWWNLSNLTAEDFKPVELGNGRTIKITLAERAYIAKSKALLRKKDNDKINEFLPELDNLMTNHPDMTYPGYFYGKLLLSTGSTQADALRVIVPFAKKKATEFWVWQLMSDVFTADQEKQLACLLRAVNSRTKEEFLSRVRIKLADLYIKQGKYDLARNQIDIVTKTCLSFGRRIPYEIDTWIHQSWFDATKPNDKEDLDYKAITDEILGDKREEAIAVVLYVDPNTERVSMVYGLEKRMSQKLRFSVEPGMVLKLSMVNNSEGKRRILRADKCKLPTDLDYAKSVNGTIKRRKEWAFAFFNFGGEKAFVSPNVASKFNVTDGENVKALLVYDFDKKKESWGWVVVSINRQK